MTETTTMHPAKLTMWTVYDHPLDHPDCFIARLWECLPSPTPTTHTLKAPTLYELRRLLQQQNPSLVRLNRSVDDEPQIVEVWL